MSTSTTYPGLQLPTQKSFTSGTGNPRDSAIASMKQTTISQNNLNNAVKTGGGRRKYRTTPRYHDRTRRKRRRRFGGAGVAVPQFQMQYTPQGGPGTNPNDQIKALSSTGMQSAAWSAKDAAALSKGGWGYRPRKTRRRIR